MSLHPEYKHVHRRILFVGYTALGVGGFGLIVPILPGLLFILVGLSVLSIESRSAHRKLAILRARYPTLSGRLAALETWVTDIFNLTTHTHEYLSISTRGNHTLSVLAEVSKLQKVGTAVLLHRAGGTKETEVPSALAEALRSQGLTVVRFDAYNGLRRK